MIYATAGYRGGVPCLTHSNIKAFYYSFMQQEPEDLYQRGTDDPDFPGRFQQLRASVLAHAKREERYEFPYLNDRVEPAARQRLASGLRAAQRFAPTRPHPGVESATANVLAGPPLAVLDRIRDAVRDGMRDREQGQ